MLHLGQVEFDNQADLSGDVGVIADMDPVVQAAKLLGVEVEVLQNTLIKKKNLVIRGECVSSLYCTHEDF